LVSQSFKQIFKIYWVFAFRRFMEIALFLLNEFLRALAVLKFLHHDHNIHYILNFRRNFRLYLILVLQQIQNILWSFYIKRY
jgi:hypothetical protein